ncbi:hypothetical protein [Anaerobacillus arseniciselenatis]|uniref:hypothetical protein n=1 Tax=Anaerobacillus arseniciselenatis TaxID=85682 RepID=UPI0014712EA3|nr:hypothetical protein [Anaerobacillus arseniciselenatis]
MRKEQIKAKPFLSVEDFLINLEAQGVVIVPATTAVQQYSGMFGIKRKKRSSKTVSSR